MLAWLDSTQSCSLSAARRIARQAALLAQVVEVVAATRQHLVDVGLMAGVEDDRVVRRVEHPVQRERQLDDAEVGAEMSTGCSDLVNQELTDLASADRSAATATGAADQRDRGSVQAFRQFTHRHWCQSCQGS